MTKKKITKKQKEIADALVAEEKDIRWTRESRALDLLHRLIAAKDERATMLSANDLAIWALSLVDSVTTQAGMFARFALPDGTDVSTVAMKKFLADLQPAPKFLGRLLPSGNADEFNSIASALQFYGVKAAMQRPTRGGGLAFRFPSGEADKLRLDPSNPEPYLPINHPHDDADENRVPTGYSLYAVDGTPEDLFVEGSEWLPAVNTET